MERVIAVIPARYASHRLPAKPLVDLLGKPMICRVYEKVLQASLPADVLVATDDERIADAVRGIGGKVMMTAADIRSGSDRVAAVARQVEGDIFVNVQGDEPLIAPAMIDEAIRVVLETPSALVGTLVRRIDSAEELQNPGIVKVVVSAAHTALYFSRAAVPFLRDRANPADWVHHHVYYKHIGMYVFRRQFLLDYSAMAESGLEKAERLEQLRILEQGIPMHVGITEHDSIPVDTPEDVRRVTDMLRAIQ